MVIAVVSKAQYITESTFVMDKPFSLIGRRVSHMEAPFSDARSAVCHSEGLRAFLNSMTLSSYSLWNILLLWFFSDGADQQNSGCLA